MINILNYKNILKYFPAIIFSSIMILFPACEKDQDNGDYEMHPFHGIVMRDNLGNYDGILDEDDGDWTFMDEFNLLERELFTEYTFPEYSVNKGIYTLTTYTDDIIVYPNPATSLITMNYVLPEGAHGTFKIILINQDYNVLWAQEQPVATGIFSILITLDAIPGIETDRTYRLLYCTIDEFNNFDYMGHGDVLLIPY